MSLLLGSSDGNLLPLRRPLTFCSSQRRRWQGEGQVRGGGASTGDAGGADVYQGDKGVCLIRSAGLLPYNQRLIDPGWKFGVKLCFLFATAGWIWNI